MPISCAPADLVSASACFECVPREAQKQVELYLLALIAGGSMDPATIVKNAACFACIPKAMHDAVAEYLLCQIANK